MDITLLILVIYFSVAGSMIGTLSGVLPGIHVNTLALLLTTSYPAIESLLLPSIMDMGYDESTLPLLIASMITSASVVHSFVDFVPSVFLGAPDEESVMSMLPGHRMLLSGNGMEAVACAAEGSLIGAVVSIALCVPLSLVLGPPMNLFSYLDMFIPVVIIVSIIVLIASERGQEVACIGVKRIALSKPHLSLVTIVPVDGREVEISGRIEGDLLSGHSIVGASGTYPIKGVRRAPSSFVIINGIWRIKRRSIRKRVLAISIFLLSGSLGFVVMKATPPLSSVWSGLNESILFPLLTGLFGLPTLLLASSSSHIPEQKMDSEHRSHVKDALRGAISGAVVGWFPGITSTTGTVIASSISRRKRGDIPGRFISMVSSVGTAATVFSLLAFAIAQKGRSGAMLAVKDVLGDYSSELSIFPSEGFALLLISALVAAAIGYFLTLKIGSFFALKFSGKDSSKLNKGIAVLLIILVAIFTGLPGLIVLSVSTILGTIPPKVGVSRVHLTGCLLLPLLIYFLGLETNLLDFLN